MNCVVERRKKPTVYIIAGPNGAGKTTFAMKFLPRIADRVSKGGHNIPAEVVGRRFKRGIHNLFNLYRGLCDLIVIYDNSTAEPRLAATIAGSETTVVRPDLFQAILNIECEAL